MPFADAQLARRLERAEGYACAQFAAAQRRLSPESPADWIDSHGTFAVFNGIDSPITQSFGLGIAEPLDEACLTAIERFFLDRGTAPTHEVSPFAGVPGLDLLCQRGYRPIELSSVLYRAVEVPIPSGAGRIDVHVTTPGDNRLWARINALGWSHDYPDLLDVIANAGMAGASREGTVCFLAGYDGVPGAAGALCIHEGVALFAGAATLPELRRRGLQSALLQARMRYAHEHGCDLAMMVAEAGSGSQRNAERNQFRVAYTRTKWQSRLSVEAAAPSR